MKRTAYHFLLFGATLLLAVGCSTKKNTFLSRSYHGTVTKYNVMFNGKEAFSKGLTTVRENYKDNFWELLPVERLTLLEDDLGDRVYNPNFKRAEDKAVKSIQKHSMVFDGRQRNKQIDEAYLLLGQARYFDQRFLPAQEAFRFLLQNYAKSDRWNEGLIWLAKTQIRLEQEEKALQSLHRLTEQRSLSTDALASAEAVKAMAYLQLQQPDSAIAPLQLAAGLTKDNELSARYSYILGQLYQNKGERDSAAIAFQQVVDFHRKIPREYYVNAQLAMMQNEALSWEEHTEFFNDYIKDRENRPFLNKIYFQRAQFCLAQDSTELAIKNLNKALQANTNDRPLASRSYELLSDYWFEKKDYTRAGAYLDSTLTQLDQKTRKHRSVKRKLDNLQEVIELENTLSETDSILRLTQLNSEQQQAFFKDFLEREAARVAKEAAAKVADNQQTVAASQSKNNFYFYNASLVAQGKKDFVRIWGNRSLADDWRLAKNQNYSQDQQEDSTPKESSKTKLDPVDTWVQKIPTDPKEIDSLEQLRNQTYFDVGVTYKEKFSDFSLAEQRLKTLLSLSPSPKLKLAAHYHLYKTLQAQNAPESEVHKAEILKDFPNSPFAELLRNPSSALSEVGQLTKALGALQKEFADQQFESVIATADKNILQTENTAFAAQFSLLKATAIGRLDGKEAYQQSLEQLVAVYPRQMAGIEAAQQLERIKQWTTPKKATSGEAKIVFPLLKSDTETSQKIQTTLQRAIDELEKTHLSVSVDVYDRSYQFVVVHGFPNASQAEGFAELIRINKSYLVREKNFVALSSDFKNGLIYKTLDSFF